MPNELLTLQVTRTGLHAVEDPVPASPVMGTEDHSGWLQQARVALQRLLPAGLGGRGVQLLIDDTLTMPGVLSGELWRLQRRDLAEAARAWFIQQAGPADWRVAAALQVDGRHAIVCAMPGSVLDALQEAITGAGGRLASAVPQWALALAAAEAAGDGAHSVACVAQAERQLVVLAIRKRGAWIAAESQPLPPTGDWCDVVEGFLARQTVLAPDGKGAGASDSAALELRRLWVLQGRSIHQVPRAAVSEPSGIQVDGRPAPPGWQLVEGMTGQGPAPSAWSAATLDFTGATPCPIPRGSWAAVVAAAALFVSILGATWLDYRAAQQVQMELNADRSVLPTPSPQVSSTTVTSPPVSAAILRELKAELARMWVPLLDRIALVKPPSVILQRVEPQAGYRTGEAFRLMLSGQAADPRDVVDWVDTLRGQPNTSDARLNGWQVDIVSGRVAFELEVVGSTP